MSATGRVIVDDRDSSIHYGPAPSGWLKKGLGRPIEFGSTTSLPGVVNDSAVFNFTGTSVAVYGTMGPGDGTSMLFSVDGAPPFTLVRQPGEDTQHHLLYYQSPDLSDGAHSLSITLESFEGQEAQLFVDYLMYTTTDTAGKTLFVDDADSGVVFSPTGWQASPSELYFQSTSHISQAPGAWVSITFEGTSLSAHGTYIPGPDDDLFSASAVIDGGAPIPLKQLRSAVNNTELFITPTALPLGQHTVNITVSGGSLFPVDYFLINPPLDPSATSDSNAANSSPSTRVETGAAQTAQAGSAEQTSPPNTVVGAAKSSSGSNVAVAVGGTIAGVVVLLLLVAGVFLWRRRSRRKQEAPSGGDFFVPAVTQWAGKGGTAGYRDSMATLTNFDAAVAEKPTQFQQPPKRGSRYLSHQDS